MYPKPTHSTHSGLWSRNFTIITIGSVVSMIGAGLSGFILGILVLDYTGSTVLYAVYQACYMLPYMICPLLAGPYLDRVSRKKVIYRLDYFSAGLYLTMYFLFRSYFGFPLLILVSLIIGTIDSVYIVAYDSLYPNLIPDGCYSKAYSVASILGSVSMAVTPVAAFLYDQLGSVRPLFLFNALCFFTAASFERTIQYEEKHVTMATVHANVQGTLRQFLSDLEEGMSYLGGEKGLLYITLYFVMCNMMGTAGNTLYLPFFRNNSALFAALPVAAVTLYSVVTTFAEIGRIVGGAVNYKVKLPDNKRFVIAFAIYITIALIDASILYMPIPLMAAAFFLLGLLAVTSYNIRITSTQAYVPDNKRARFNGMFRVVTSIGSTVGNLLAGGAAAFVPERTAVLIFSLFELVSAILIMFHGRKHVSTVYNIELNQAE